jgi:hypothetical protein
MATNESLLIEHSLAVKVSTLTPPVISADKSSPTSVYHDIRHNQHLSTLRPFHQAVRVILTKAQWDRFKGYPTIPQDLDH